MASRAFAPRGFGVVRASIYVSRKAGVAGLDEFVGQKR
jgi:hypothetical protein